MCTPTQVFILDTEHTLFGPWDSECDQNAGDILKEVDSQTFTMQDKNIMNIKIIFLCHLKLSFLPALHHKQLKASRGVKIINMMTGRHSV